jgi:hypothetical protein
VVFVGEVVMVAVILVFANRMVAAPPNPETRLDVPGAILTASGLGFFVFGLLRSGTWGFIQPKSGAPEWLGLSPAFWLMLGGLLVLRLFMAWEYRVVGQGREPLVDPELLKVRQLRAGLSAFFFQFILQYGLFFLMSLYLTVALGLSAVATGVRLTPLSIALLLAAVGIPKRFPNASPRTVVRFGFLLLTGGLLLLIVLLGVGTGPEIVTWPLILAGLGMGALASQLGAVTVAAVPDERSGEVGGLQNTGTNLGASIATALAGAVLVAALTTSLFTKLADNPDVPPSVLQNATVQLSAGVPFVSDSQLEAALSTAGVDDTTAAAIAQDNADARIGALQASLGVLVLLGAVALFVSRAIPRRIGQPDPLPTASAGA